ncbi:phospholipase A2 [Meiothermus rufus]|uniref:phospholipase A2 n=1 Tax=Meiothermus rufus TaxID=604332 RepID=UPI00040EBA3A|nr:phospholipase A2 [Meiothermus rufus]
MQKITRLGWLMLLLVLAACGQSNLVETPAELEILQDMRRLGVEPEAIAAYEASLQNLSTARQEVESLSAGDLQLVQMIALGSIANYDSYYTAQANYPQFDWSRDGCSAPEGLGLGYRETFRPACNVHDFGYANFPRFPTLYNETGRRLADDNFLVNMNSICRPKSFLSRAACYSAAYTYYSAVRVAGWAYFYD